MNCEQVGRLMATGRPLPQEAVEHLERCSICSELNALGRATADQAVDPALEQRIIAEITRGLQPVRPLASPWVYVLCIMAATGLVAILGVSILGIAGWNADSMAQKAWFMACLTSAIAACAVTISKLMVPDAALPISPGLLVLLSSAVLAAGALSYPAAYYERFGRSVAACLFIGLSHAALLSLLILGIIRRGAFLARPQVLETVALAGGLTGVVVLFVFCPHRDLGHIALAHATVPAMAAATGVSIARRLHFTAG